MGVFDYIRCELPLPKTPTPPPESDGGLFQSKDTPDQWMTIYTITADGRLSWRPYHTAEVPKKERPYPDADGPLALVGFIRRVEREPEFVDFHGDIEFGTISTREGRYSGGTWDYRARFTDGRCEKIDLIDYSPEDDATPTHPEPRP